MKMILLTTPGLEGGQGFGVLLLIVNNFRCFHSELDVSSPALEGLLFVIRKKKSLARKKAARHSLAL